MADNVAITPGSGAVVGADEATYSGDTAKVQLVRLVHVTGSEGTKTVEELIRAEDSAHASGHNGLPMLAVRQDTAASLAGTDGDYTFLIVDSSGRLHVLPSGNVAHDAVDSDNPVKVGAKAAATLSTATLVAAADRTDATADLDGALITRTNYALGDLVSGNASNTDGSSTQVLAAGASGVKHYITDVTITNTSSSNIYVELKDNTTVKWTFPVPANGGVTHHFASPLAGTAATAWNFDPSAAATTVYCSVSGFKSKI